MIPALEGVSGRQHTPAAIYSRERPGTHFTGGWVGPKAVWIARNLIPTGILFVRYDFIQCSMVLYTRDIIGNKKSPSDVLLSAVF